MSWRSKRSVWIWPRNINDNAWSRSSPNLALVAAAARAWPSAASRSNENMRRGGEVHVQHGLGAEHAQLAGSPPGLEEAGRSGVVEHVDRSELVQSTKAPHREAGPARRATRLLEGLPGRAEIVRPVRPADELKSMATDRN